LIINILPGRVDMGSSVSQSKVEVVKRYIENQKTHHKTETFKEEYLRFLKEYDIEYNDDYLWNLNYVLLTKMNKKEPSYRTNYSHRR